MVTYQTCIVNFLSLFSPWLSVGLQACLLSPQTGLKWTHFCVVPGLMFRPQTCLGTCLGAPMASKPWAFPYAHQTSQELGKSWWGGWGMTTVEALVLAQPLLLWPGPGPGSCYSMAQVCHPGQGPMILLKRLQKLPGDFFWNGHHWPPQIVPDASERGQGLIDLVSRVAAFPLQAF